MSGDKTSDWKLFWIVSISVVVLWLVNIFLMYWLASSAEVRGQFGDMFGALTSLFTGLAFAGLITTLIMQRKELQLQRDELSATREELAGQREQLELQNLQTRKQIFEGTFFQYLAVFNTYISDITGVSRKDGAIPLTGRDQLAYIARGFCGWRYIFGLSEHADDKAHEEYERLYEENRDDLGAYFRLLYNIFKLIERSAPVSDKDFYRNLVRAQLSEAELVLIHLNLVTERGKKFLDLLGDYNITKHAPVTYDGFSVEELTGLLAKS